MAVTDGAFAVIVMVTRAEYLAGSFSRLQPWLAEGISRRQWERRRRKITAPSASQRAVTSGPAKGARRPRHRDLTADVGSPADEAPRFRLGPADDRTPVPAHRRTLLREDEDALLRRIHVYWDAQGMRPSDPQSLARAIHAIAVPERLKHMDRRALRKVYRRARERLPLQYDHWISLVEKWDKSYNRQKARNLVDALITGLGNRPSSILNRLFDHLEQQYSENWKRKVERLEAECERLESDECYMPKVRELKKDELHG